MQDPVGLAGPDAVRLAHGAGARCLPRRSIFRPPHARRGGLSSSRWPSRTVTAQHCAVTGQSAHGHRTVAAQHYRPATAQPPHSCHAITVQSPPRHCTPIAQSPYSHHTVTTQSLHSHHTVTAQSLHSHYTVTTQSLHSHCTVTAQSLHSHRTVTAQSPHIRLTVAAQPPRNHSTVAAQPLHDHYTVTCRTSTDLQAWISDQRGWSQRLHWGCAFFLHGGMRGRCVWTRVQTRELACRTPLELSDRDRFNAYRRLNEECKITPRSPLSVIFFACPGHCSGGRSIFQRRAVLTTGAARLAEVGRHNCIGHN